MACLKGTTLAQSGCVAIALWLAPGCGSSASVGGNSAGAGGTTGSGGMGAAGASGSGKPATGGVPGSGGRLAAGGAPGGGSARDAGANGAGGSSDGGGVRAGGATGAGGNVAAGGHAGEDSGTKLPTRAYGYSAHTLGQADPAAYLTLASSGGATTIRDDFAWAGIEPNRLDFHWADPDKIVTLAAQHGMSILAMAGYGAAWSTGCAATKCGPLDVADYAEFVRQIALRYGRRGSFWAANPTVPRMPLAGIEIWNEPNLEGFWANPNAAKYAAMLEAAYTAIKSVDAEMIVVSAGLAPYSTYPTTNSPLKFLETMYQNGAHGFMDAVGYHPYYFFQGATAAQMVSGGSWAEMSTTTPSVRSLMQANGDGALTVWATELGAPTWSGGVTEAEQADLATREVTAWKSFPGAGHYYWYDLRDDGTDPADREHHFGAVRHDGSLKPSYATLKAGWTSP